MKNPIIIISYLIIGAFGLSSCGIRGSLETAPPVFGPAKAKYEAEKAQKEAEEKKTKEAEAPQ